MERMDKWMYGWKKGQKHYDHKTYLGIIVRQ